MGYEAEAEAALRQWVDAYAKLRVGEAGWRFRSFAQAVRELGTVQRPAPWPGARGPGAVGARPAGRGIEETPASSARVAEAGAARHRDRASAGTTRGRYSITHRVYRAHHTGHRRNTSTSPGRTTAFTAETNHQHGRVTRSRTAPPTDRRHPGPVPPARRRPASPPPRGACGMTDPATTKGGASTRRCPRRRHRPQRRKGLRLQGMGWVRGQSGRWQPTAIADGGCPSTGLVIPPRCLKGGDRTSRSEPASGTASPGRRLGRSAAAAASRATASTVPCSTSPTCTIPLQAT